MAEKIQSAERVSHEDTSDNYVFQRSLLAYHKAAGIVSGDVLEIGTGSGYGISVIAPSARRFITLDKHIPPKLFQADNVEFRQKKVPPLEGIPTETFDFVVSFQVIEHIRRDRRMIEEIARVLRPGGKLVISTPNKYMSITRNPWHIREYTPDQFDELLSSYFSDVQALGVYGKPNVMEYYNENKQSVANVLRYDVLGFNKWLPRPLLKIPYDIMNRLNRRKLLKENTQLTSGIKMDDYYLDKAEDGCFDLFYIATK